MLYLPNNWSPNTDGTWSLGTAASDDEPENNRCYQSKCWECSSAANEWICGLFCRWLMLVLSCCTRGWVRLYWSAVLNPDRCHRTDLSRVFPGQAWYDTWSPCPDSINIKWYCEINDLPETYTHPAAARYKFIQLRDNWTSVKPRCNNMIGIHYREKTCRGEFAAPEKFLWIRMSYWINEICLQTRSQA